MAPLLSVLEPPNRFWALTIIFGLTPLDWHGVVLWWSFHCCLDWPPPCRPQIRPWIRGLLTSGQFSFLPFSKVDLSRTLSDRCFISLNPHYHPRPDFSRSSSFARPSPNPHPKRRLGQLVGKVGPNDLTRKSMWLEIYWTNSFRINLISRATNTSNWEFF